MPANDPQLQLICQRGQREKWLSMDYLRGVECCNSYPNANEITFAVILYYQLWCQFICQRGQREWIEGVQGCNSYSNASYCDESFFCCYYVLSTLIWCPESLAQGGHYLGDAVIQYRLQCQPMIVMREWCTYTALHLVIDDVSGIYNALTWLGQQETRDFIMIWEYTATSISLKCTAFYTQCTLLPLQVTAFEIEIWLWGCLGHFKPRSQL